MPSIAIKPGRPGLKVRYPEMDRHLKAEGETVTLDSWWRRRLADGDVVPAQTNPQPAERPKKREE